MVFRRFQDWLILLLPYWLRHRKNTGAVWSSPVSAGNTRTGRKLCQQPGHMVSWINIWLAGILNCLISSYHTHRRDFLPSKPILLQPHISESFPPIHSFSEKRGLFSHVESLWVQESLFVPIITHCNFECMLGLKYPFPTPTSRWCPGCCQEQQQKENKTETWMRVHRSHSHQTGLLPESNSPLSGCPMRRPSLGRWRLNVQPV